MELTDSVMCDLHLDVHMGLNDSFGFSPRAMGSMSSNSTSSSCTSSDYGPFTPTSGRSTSPRSNSMDFGASFDSYNPLSFDLTPPSSAVSTSFSMGSSFTGDGFDLLLSDMPITPTRSRVNTEFSHMTLGGCTPSSTIPMYSFAESALGPAFTSSPGYGTNWDLSSMWAQPETPVNFELFPAPPKGLDRSMNEVKKASAALQREQQKTKQGSRATGKRGPVKQDVEFDSHGGLITKTKKRVPCEIPNCPKTYLRVEHMRRHLKAHTGEIIFCAWCKHFANREDNFSYHLRKHLAAESKSPRVHIVTDPVEVAKIEKMMAKMNTRRKGDRTEPEYKARPKCKTEDESKSEFDYKPKMETYKTELYETGLFKTELHKTEHQFKEEAE